MAESFIKIIQTKEIITSRKKLWSLNKFSMSVPKKTLTEERIENMYTDVTV